MPNLDITYIRNMREKQNYVYALPPYENLHQEPETETKLFLCPSTSSDTDGCAADTSAHIYARGGSFFKLGINGNLGWGAVGEGFFCFCQKKIRMTIWDGEILEMLLRWEMQPTN